jgi:hypothetical protein
MLKSAWLRKGLVTKEAFFPVGERVGRSGTEVESEEQDETPQTDFVLFGFKFRPRSLSVHASALILKLSRRIADLVGSRETRSALVAEAVGYRSLDDTCWRWFAAVDAYGEGNRYLLGRVRQRRA